MEGLIPKIGVLLLICSQFSPLNGYSSGAPSAVCDTLIPGHGEEPQKIPTLYKIIVENTQKINVNTPISITLTSLNGQDEFKGFLVQVRKASLNKNQDDKIYEGGVFVENSNNKDVRSLACSGKPNLAMTHKGAEPKKRVTVRWIPKVPGHYRVHATFVKDGATYWVNQTNDQIIEVISQEDSRDPMISHQNEDKMDMDVSKMCSTLKMNSSLELITGTNSPYVLTVGPVVSSSSSAGNPHKIYQKELMWINVTSEYGTPIQKMFVQVRPQKSVQKAVGKFKSVVSNPADGDFKLVDCFGGNQNGVIFYNRMYGRTATDVSIKWEAPYDLTGDFEIVGTVISSDDSYWDKFTDDHEAGRITVIKKSSPNSGNKKPETGMASSSASSFSKSPFDVNVNVVVSKRANSSSSPFIFGAIKLIMFFTITMITAL